MRYYDYLCKSLCFIVAYYKAYSVDFSSCEEYELFIDFSGRLNSAIIVVNAIIFYIDHYNGFIKLLLR